MPRNRSVRLAALHNVTTAQAHLRDALAWFVGAIDKAEDVAVYLQESVESVGCLIGYGMDGEGQAKGGNVLLGHDAPALLFAIAHAIDTIRALIFVGDAASQAL